MNRVMMALGWELWRRHRRRLAVMAAVLLGFALFYPAACAHMRLRMDDPEASVVSQAAGLRDAGASTPAKVAQLVALLFLLCGPYACVGASALYVGWAFTLVDPASRPPLKFPRRLFTLPVSSAALAGWLMAGGCLAMMALYAAWTTLVPLPHVVMLESLMNPLAWQAAVLVSLPVIWALDHFPLARMVALITVLSGLGFMFGPSVDQIPWLERNRVLLALGAALAGVVAGPYCLGRIRRGDWQVWSWKTRLLAVADSLQRKGPMEFQTPAQAQFWFEWRRLGRPLMLTTAGLTGIPFLLVVLVVTFDGPLEGGGTFRLAAYLCSVPLFLAFCHGHASGVLRPLAFTGVRPVDNGELLMAELKALAAGSLLSWVFILALLSLVPLLGPLALAEELPVLQGQENVFWMLSPVLFVGFVFLTWRLGMASQWCVAAPRTPLAGLPGMLLTAVLVIWGLIAYFARQPELRDLVLGLVLVVLGVLLVAKFVFASWSLRTAVRLGLLGAGTLRQYVMIWSALAVLFLTPVVLLWRQAPWLIQLCLGIVLLLPLGRVGLAPLALKGARHR